MLTATAPQAIVAEFMERQHQQRLVGILKGAYLSQAISCVVELGIPDLLAGGPKSATALAEELGCAANYLSRILRALCAAGIFELDEGGCIRLNPMSELLREGAAGSLRALTLHQAKTMHIVLSCLSRSVREGVPAWHLAFGKDPWGFFRDHPENAAWFDETMEWHDTQMQHAVISALELQPSDVVMDVGGGNGSFLREILLMRPDVLGILFDIPEVVDRAVADPRWIDLQSRCCFLGGDLFADIPGPADVLVLRHVLHDWDDGDALRILEVVRRSMRPNDRICVVESGAGGSDGTSSAWRDVGMMLMGGRERTQEEFERLFRAAGFFLERINCQSVMMTYHLRLNVGRVDQL